MPRYASPPSQVSAPYHPTILHNIPPCKGVEPGRLANIEKCWRSIKTYFFFYWSVTFQWRLLSDQILWIITELHLCGYDLTNLLTVFITSQRLSSIISVMCADLCSVAPCSVSNCSVASRSLLCSLRLRGLWSVLCDSLLCLWALISVLWMLNPSVFYLCISVYHLLP